MNTKSPMDQLAEQLGFATSNEMWSLIANADISTKEKMQAFENWKLNDGTKDGLMKLPAKTKTISK